jgi:hypothetical protein
MKAGDGTRLISRNGIQHTKRFPELVQALDSLSAGAFILDGEVAVYDRALISRFARPPGIRGSVEGVPGRSALTCGAIAWCAWPVACRKRRTLRCAASDVRSWIAALWAARDGAEHASQYSRNGKRTSAKRGLDLISFRPLVLPEVVKGVSLGRRD